MRISDWSSDVCSSDLRVVATDASEPALAVASGNAAALGIGNVEFRHGDWLAPLAGERFALIASNPPYISGDDAHLEHGDLRFEPRAALPPAADGLAAIRRIAPDAPAHRTSPVEGQRLAT